MKSQLSPQDQNILLQLAREAVTDAVNGEPIPGLDLNRLPEILKEERASFVTLTINDQLRGCIGTIEAYRPLAIDVQEHAVAAALHDFRFPPVKPAETELIRIEISVLTPKTPLHYEKPQELLTKIRPQVDGVILEDGHKKATFLPQVWEKVPDPETFLSHLCLKMGAPFDLWCRKPIKAYVYQVEKFREEESSQP